MQLWQCKPWGGEKHGLCLSNSPPAQGGIQILGRAEARLGSGIGVPVIMQLKFQQSFVVSVDVPHIPFIDRVVDISVASQRQGRTVQTVQKTGDSPGAVLGLGHARRCATTGPNGPDSSVWGCSRCSSCQVVDVPAVCRTSRSPGVAGRCLRSAHR